MLPISPAAPATAHSAAGAQAGAPNPALAAARRPEPTAPESQRDPDGGGRTGGDAGAVIVEGSGSAPGRSLAASLSIGGAEVGRSRLGSGGGGADRGTNRTRHSGLQK